MGNSHDHTTLEKVRTYLDNVEVLFIDGAHASESVAKDWTMYHSLVRPGGLVVFHDAVSQLPDRVPKFLERLSRGAIDNKRHILHNIVYSDYVGISYEEC